MYWKYVTWSNFMKHLEIACFYTHVLLFKIAYVLKYYTNTRHCLFLLILSLPLKIYQWCVLRCQSSYLNHHQLLYLDQSRPITIIINLDHITGNRGLEIYCHGFGSTVFVAVYIGMCHGNRWHYSESTFTLWHERAHWWKSVWNPKVWHLNQVQQSWKQTWQLANILKNFC